MSDRPIIAVLRAPTTIAWERLLTVPTIAVTRFSLEV
jgi:hypothetical protein